MVYDIAIIGAGVVGTLTARTLSKYNLKNVLLEKTSDVAMGTTKANSGIVHAGYDAKVGSLKAKLNVQGCRMMEDLCNELFVPYERNGSLVVAFSEAELPTLQELYDRGLENGLTPDEIEIIDQKKLRELEPNISDVAVGALYAPCAGIVSPYELAEAGAECAVSNGTDFVRDYAVDNVTLSDGVFTITSTDGKELQAKMVINAAGLYAEELKEKFDGDKAEKHTIIPRLGEYGLLDRSCEGLVSHTIFQCPTEMGKGILVAPTTHHNILVGPTAVDSDGHDDSYIHPDTSVRVGALRSIFKMAQKSIPSVSPRDMITNFAGLRAHDATAGDFGIDVSKTSDHFINLIGIESPGLASSPAIAEYVRELVVKILGSEPEVKADFDPSRKEPVFLRELTLEEQEKLVAENPDYGRIICRCETVTEGEIRDAIRRPAGAVDIDGVKRRTRAGMGRCQGGFCGSKVQEILAEELNRPINKITKFGGESDIIYERTK